MTEYESKQLLAAYGIPTVETRIAKTEAEAAKAAGETTRRTQGAVVASDAFFPFRDSIDEVASYGVTSIVQPGGSIRDEEVIAAANEHGIAMLFTGVRHFKH